MKKNVWVPFSSNAYGANAVFIPKWGQKTAIEFILVMTQNYPIYKTHPVLDLFHNYITGPERFQSNYEFRVLGWEIDKDCRRWSFLYLPTESQDVLTTAIFMPTAQGNMRLFLDMKNPSDEKREWEFHLYIAPCRGISLAGYAKNLMDRHNFRFTMDNVRMKLFSRKLIFHETSEVKSNFWINFPLNANELSCDPDNPRSREKRRALIKFFPVNLNPHTSNIVTIDFIAAADYQENSVRKPVDFPAANQAELPYKHLWWETLHNRQYTKSFRGKGMTDRIIPGKEWGMFYLWDGGMTALGVLEQDEEMAEKVISEMPDPEKVGEKVFNHGSFIPTAVFATWELYQKTGDTKILRRHYGLMKNLVLSMYRYPFDRTNDLHDGMVRPVRNRAGTDDYPALVYADGWPYAFDYRETLPVNPSRKFQQIISVGMTCLAVRFLKILRMAAYVLGKRDDISAYSVMIEKSEKTMNEDYWDERRECFLNRLESEKNLLEMEGVYEYLALLSGSVASGRKDILLKKLTDAHKYWTPYGITVVAQDDPNYREDGYWNGGIWMPVQWLFWKTFYNLGLMDMAKTIADAAIELWDSNHKTTLCCWEKFCLKNGAPAGNSRFSGLSVPLMALWNARRRVGRIQSSQEVIIEKKSDIKKGVFEVFIEAPFYAGPCGLSIVTGKPDTEYSVQTVKGGIKNTTSDNRGYIGFSVDVSAKEKVGLKIFPKKQNIF